MTTALARDPHPSVEERLREFVVREVKWDPSNGALDVGHDLIGGGELDSIGVFRVIAYAEAEFGIKVHDDEIRIDNFKSLERIARLVHAKLSP